MLRIKLFTCIHAQTIIIGAQMGVFNTQFKPLFGVLCSKGGEHFQTHGTLVGVVDGECVVAALYALLIQSALLLNVSQSMIWRRKG